MGVHITGVSYDRGLAGPALIIAGRSAVTLLDAALAVAADLGLPVVNCPTLASSDTLSIWFEAKARVERRVHSMRGGASTQNAVMQAFATLTQLVLEGKPRTLIDDVLRFATEVGLPITLAEVGLTDPPSAVLHQVAERATARGESIHHEPFPVRADMVADALLTADAAGRAWKRRHP